MSNEINLAWCAGFFDGEGHVSYHRGYPSPVSGKVSAQLYAAISQASTNIEVLEFFQTVTCLGKIKGPYKMPNGNPQHRLLFGVNEVGPLFTLLRPYLKLEKTIDFQRALKGYMLHDSESTEEDFERLQRKLDKKRKKKV
jgi:hypothetical protein